MTSPRASSSPSQDSTRIGASFDVEPNARLLVEGVDSHVVRLMARVRLRMPDGWSNVRPALVDLGAPYSIIPLSAWHAAQHRILVKEPLRVAGIGGHVAVAFYGQVVLIIEDEMTTSPPLSARALLLKDDSEPLLLGFEDILTRAVLHCDYPGRAAYLEFPEG